MRNCEYIKPNGEFCGSPAIRGRDYCHWHLTCIARRLRAEKQEATADHTPLELPPLEDANSVQLAIMMVGDAILRNRIGPRMAGQMLYLLQLASSNLKQGVCFQPGKQAAGDDEQEAPDVTLCSSYDSLEQDYEIQEYAEQLKASQANERIDAAEEIEEAGEEEENGGEELSEQEQFLLYMQEGGFPIPETFVPGNHDYDIVFGNWRKRKQVADEQRRQQEEELQRHWDSIRHDLSEAASSEDPERLKQLLADCYQRSGVEYEAEGWKPAAPQKVLSPRKPPEGVQQQWYQQRQANCNAEFDKITEREAARKKIS